MVSMPVGATICWVNTVRYRHLSGLKLTMVNAFAQVYEVDANRYTGISIQILFMGLLIE